VQRAESGLLLNFSRKKRLAKRHEFKTVFASPHKILYKYLLVKYQFNQKDLARLGIIVAKRYIHRATDRNRFRRALKESFRHHQNSLKGLDIVVVMRSKCSPLPKASLRKPKGACKTRSRNRYGTADNQTLRNDINNLWHQLLASLKTV
jgi:ribonuclease P protein component